MKIVDTNVLLYAVDGNARHHGASKQWLDGALSGIEPVGFPWIVSIAFLRLSTSKRVYPAPLTPDLAVGVLEDWHRQSPAVTPEPGLRHLETVRNLLAHTGSGGNLVNDAHIAAIALQHSAPVVSFDNDFARFPGVTWEQPPPARA